jgi:3-dehydroquinate synthase
MPRIINRDVSALQHIVSVSSGIKIHVVERDEKETTGLRSILNFGHTFAHAFEAAQNYGGISHGEAVALGMMVASKLSSTLGIFSSDCYRRLHNVLERAGLVRRIRRYRFNVETLLKYMQRDKKKKGKALKIVLPLTIGKVKVFGNIKKRDIRKVLKQFF